MAGPWITVLLVGMALLVQAIPTTHLRKCVQEPSSSLYCEEESLMDAETPRVESKQSKSPHSLYFSAEDDVPRTPRDFLPTPESGTSSWSSEAAAQTPGSQKLLKALQPGSYRLLSRSPSSSHSPPARHAAEVRSLSSSAMDLSSWEAPSFPTTEMATPAKTGEEEGKEGKEEEEDLFTLDENVVNPLELDLRTTSSVDIDSIENVLPRRRFESFSPWHPLPWRTVSNELTQEEVEILTRDWTHAWDLMYTACTAATNPALHSTFTQLFPEPSETQVSFAFHTTLFNLNTVQMQGTIDTQRVLQWDRRRRNTLLVNRLLFFRAAPMERLWQLVSAMLAPLLPEVVSFHSTACYAIASTPYALNNRGSYMQFIRAVVIRLQKQGQQITRSHYFIREWQEDRPQDQETEYHSLFNRWLHDEVD